MGYQHKQNEIYGNCKVYSIDGQLMFLCGEKKIKWYLSRNLADIIETSDQGTSIKLNFKSKGLGKNDDPFYLEEKTNSCCVCGDDEKLTRHHCVPYQYRQHFPDNYKKSMSHDVVPLCTACHTDYELEAFKLKKKISNQFNIPIENNKISIENLNILHARKDAHALATYKNIPLDRQKVIKDRIAICLGHEPSEEELAELATYKKINITEKQKNSYGELVVRRLEENNGLDDFIKLWRKHFYDTLSPKFLPKNWSVDHPTCLESYEERKLLCKI